MQRLPPPVPKAKKKASITPPPRAAVRVSTVPTVPRSQARGRPVEKSVNVDRSGQGHGRVSPVPYGSPGYKPADFGAPRRRVPTKPTSLADVAWAQMTNPRTGSFGADVRSAANPRIAALSSVGELTGIPALVSATRKHQWASAVAQAALFAIPGGGEAGALGRAAEKGAVEAFVRGSGRTAFGKAIRKAAVDSAEAKAAVAHADAYVASKVRHLPAAERGPKAQSLYDELRGTIAPRRIPGFDPRVPQGQGQANLRSIMKPGNVQPPKNLKMASLHPDANAYQVVGDITPQEWWARTQHAVGNDPAVGLKLANWYAEMGPMMKHFFGDDADAILRGFAVSQANASPAGGLTNVLRVRDKLLRGEPIKKGEISTVSKSIEAAFLGKPITEGMKAKLHDFSDALQGKTTRTWTADDIRGGMPTPTDIHALRDLGHIDHKILSTLRDRHGLPVAHLQLDHMQNELQVLVKKKLSKDMTAAQKRAKVAALRKRIVTFKNTNADAIAHDRAFGLVMDHRGVAGVRQYNHAVAKYQEITDHLNAIKAWGKSDWTPAETQALGWSAIQRFHGTVPEDAQFMVDRNTTSLAFEVLNGTTGIGDGLSPAAQYAVTKEVADAIVPRVLEAEGVITRGDLTYGLGGWQNTVSPAAYQQVIASPEQVDRVVARLANLFHQYDVWGVRTGVSISKRAGAGAGKAALEFRSTAFNDPRQTQAFWHALRARVPASMEKHFKGFSSFTHADSTPGIRVITDTAPVTKAKADSWAEQFQGFVDGAMEDVGISDLKYNPVNVEIRDAVKAKSRTGAAPRVSTRGRVGDPLATEAQSRLVAAVERHSGTAGQIRQATRDLHAKDLRFHDPHGLAHGVPVELPPAQGVEPGPALSVVPEPSAPPLTPAAASLVQRAQRGPLTLEDAVLSNLEGVNTGIAEQEALRSPDRAARARAFREAVQANPTAEGVRDASQHLVGEYPKLGWGGFETFTPEAHDAMVRFIADHPDVQDFEVKRATDALVKLRAGKMPQANEVRLLRRIFGHQATENLVRSVHWFRQRIFDILNIPRSLMASIDVSGALRQGLMIGTQNPKVWAQNLGPMMKAFASKDYFSQEMQTLLERENARNGLYERMGLDMTDLGPLGSTALREEAFATPLADKIPGVNMSSRAYMLFLNKARADLADSIYATALKKQGKMYKRWRVVDGKPTLVKEPLDANSDEFLQSIGSLVNSSSGRGDLGSDAIGKASDAINLLLFSPRLAKSRIDFLINPKFYANMHPMVRHQAYKAMGGLILMTTLTLGIAKAAGASVELDPRSSDFAKIKIGNTRIDLAGGFQQYLRVLSEIVTQQTKLSSTGNVVGLAPYRAKAGPGTQNIGGILLHFLRGKLAPVVSAGVDVVQGGNPVGSSPYKSTIIPHVPDIVASRFSPLAIQDAIETAQQTKGSTGSVPGSVLAGLAAYLAGASGAGVQSYAPRKLKVPASKKGFSQGSGFGGGSGFSQGSGFGP
jgi:hypothetical protein